MAKKMTAKDGVWYGWRHPKGAKASDRVRAGGAKREGTKGAKAPNNVREGSGNLRRAGAQRGQNGSTTSKLRSITRGGCGEEGDARNTGANIA